MSAFEELPTVCWSSPRHCGTAMPLFPRVIIRSVQADANRDYKDRPDEK